MSAAAPASGGPLSFLSGAGKQGYNPQGWDDLWGGKDAKVVKTRDELEALFADKSLILDDPRGGSHRFGENDYVAFAGPNGTAYELRWSPDYEMKSVYEMERDSGGNLLVPNGWEAVSTGSSEGDSSPQSYRKATGNYVVTPEHSKDINRYFASLHEDDGFGFFGTVAAIGLSVFGAPYLATAFGGGLGGAVAAGAVTGGASAALTGGDIGKGILTGGIGAGLGNYLGGTMGADGVVKGGVEGFKVSKNLFDAGNIARGAVTGGVTGAIRNGGTGLLSGAVNGAVGGALPGKDNALLRTGAQMLTGSLLAPDGKRTSGAVNAAADGSSASAGSFYFGTTPGFDRGAMNTRRSLAAQLRSM